MKEGKGEKIEMKEERGKKWTKEGRKEGKEKEVREKKKKQD